MKCRRAVDCAWVGLMCFISLVCDADSFLPDAMWVPNALVRARQLMDHQQYDQAAVELRMARLQAPRHVDVYLAWADWYVRSGHRGQAMILLKQAIADFPQYPEFYNDYAVLYADHHSHEAVCRILYQGLAIDPQAPVLLANTRTLECQPISQKTEPIAPKSHLIASLTVQRHKEIEKIIRDWLWAWSHQSYQSFFSFYSPYYQPPLDLTYEEWVLERRRRMEALSPFLVSRESRTRYIRDTKKNVSVCFVQTIRFSGLFRTVNKVLFFSYYHHEWKILKEFVSAVPCSDISEK